MEQKSRRKFVIWFSLHWNQLCHSFVL